MASVFADLQWAVFSALVVAAFFSLTNMLPKGMVHSIPKKELFVELLKSGLQIVAGVTVAITVALLLFLLGLK